MKEQAKLLNTFKLLFLIFSLFGYVKAEAQGPSSYSTLSSSSNQSKIEPYVLNLSFTEEDKVAFDQAEPKLAFYPAVNYYESKAKNGDSLLEAATIDGTYYRFTKKATVEITLERGQDLIIQTDDLDNLSDYLFVTPGITDVFVHKLLISNNDWLAAPLTGKLISSSPFSLAITNYYNAEWHQIHDIYWTLYYFIPTSASDAQYDVTKVQQIHIHLK